MKEEAQTVWGGEGIRMTIVVLGTLTALCVALQRKDRAVHPHQLATLTLSKDVAGNEALVVIADVPGLFSGAVFVVDTAFAGAITLSLSYLGEMPSKFPSASVTAKYQSASERAARATDASRSRALERLLSAKTCRSYTSGCTMRLMGIGEVRESHADMALCNGLSLWGRAQEEESDGEVMLTNPLPGHVHILTIDYLLHRAPCMLCPRDGIIVGNASRTGFDLHPAYFVGGAFAVWMRVGGEWLRIVVDTGASATLSLSHSRVDSLRCAAMGRHLHQTGVHGERVCSDVIRVSVQVGAWELGELEALINNVDVEGADGYAGMGMLRAFDIYLHPKHIGFRPNGLSTTGIPHHTAGTCGGAGHCAAAK